LFIENPPSKIMIGKNINKSNCESIVNCGANYFFINSKFFFKKKEKKEMF